MVEKIQQDEEDHDQIDLPELAEIGDAQGVIGEGGYQPEPEGDQQAGRRQTALPVMGTHPLFPQRVQQDTGPDETVAPVIQPHGQAKDPVLLEGVGLRTGKEDGQQQAGHIDQEPQTAEQAGAGMVQAVEVQAEDQNRRHGQVVEHGAEERVEGFRKPHGPDPVADQDGPQCVKQIFLQCAHTEQHPAAEAPDVQPVFHIGPQDQGEDGPDQKGEHQEQLAGYSIGDGVRPWGRSVHL